MYDNTYNECWGFKINDHEIAVIGSTAGTHFFDVTDPQNSIEVNICSWCIYRCWCYT